MFQTWCLTFRASHLVSLCFCLSICKMRTNIFTYLGRVFRDRQIVSTLALQIPKKKGQSVLEGHWYLVKIYTSLRVTHAQAKLGYINPGIRPSLHPGGAALFKHGHPLYPLLSIYLLVNLSPGC